MKTKLSTEEKARRQAWRDKQYAKPSMNAPHHLTKTERKAQAKPAKPIMTAAEYFMVLFGGVTKPAKVEKKPFLKARAKRVIGEAQPEA